MTHATCIRTPRPAAPEMRQPGRTACASPRLIDSERMAVAPNARRPALARGGRPRPWHGGVAGRHRDETVDAEDVGGRASGVAGDGTGAAPRLEAVVHRGECAHTCVTSGPDTGTWAPRSLACTPFAVSTSVRIGDCGKVVDACDANVPCAAQQAQRHLRRAQWWAWRGKILTTVGRVAPQGVEHVRPDPWGGCVFHRARDVVSQVVRPPRPVACPTVKDQDGVLHEGGDWQKIKGPVHRLKRHLPTLVRLAQNLGQRLVEPVGIHGFVHAPELVVAPGQPDARRARQLEGEQQAHDLGLVPAAVHEVAVEDV